MRRWGICFSCFILTLLTVLCFLITPVLAHVPTFEEGGRTLEGAIPVEDPSVSRVLYGQLTEGDQRYYSFEMEKGERIVLGLIVPVEQGKEVFTPELVLMGPGLTNEGKIPEKLEVPEGYGVKVFPGSLPESPVYEAFAPSSFYSLANPDLIAPENGTYYAVAIATRGEGNYGIVLGYKEAFTLKEWISTPFNLIKTYLWEGQSLLFIFAPLGLTIVLGLLAIFLNKDVVSGFNPARISGLLTGLFFLGTGFSLIAQMLISLNKTSFSSEVSITLFLILASIGLGVIALILSLKDENYGTASTRKRLYFFVLGIVGLFLWAGWIVGPLLAFETAVLPWKRKE
jgi:hypothetical protein